MRSRPPLRSAVPAVAVAAALTLAACAGDDDTAEDQTTTTDAGVEAADPTAGAEPGEADGEFPVTVASGAGETATEIVVEARPEAIVSLSPTATEMLFAVGAGEQVIAVDEQSDFPEGVPTTDLSGFQPNVEAVLGYEPDLVLTSNDSDPGDLVSGLEAAGVPTLLLPAATTIDDSYDQIERVGAATGNVGGAAELVLQMQTDIDAILADVPDREAPLTYYHELDSTYFTVTSATFIGDVYGQLGLQSIADEAGDPAADPFPQLSEEFIVDADPEVIFLANGEFEDVTPETVAERPGWSGITAVTEDRVVTIDADIASRWGPRIVDFMTEVAAVTTEPQPVG